jgi:hypothetical protein
VLSETLAELAGKECHVTYMNSFIAFKNVVLIGWLHADSSGHTV